MLAQTTEMWINVNELLTRREQEKYYEMTREAKEDHTRQYPQLVT